MNPVQLTKELLCTPPDQRASGSREAVVLLTPSEYLARQNSDSFLDYSCMIIKKHVPISSAKTRLLELLRQVEESHENVVITKNGLPKAVLLNYEDFAGLLETLEILADTKTMRGVKAGLRDLKAGRTVRLEDAFKE